MLTLKALYDPKTGLHFDESVQINQPVRYNRLDSFLSLFTKSIS